MKKTLFPIIMAGLVLLFSGWGSKGHRKISSNASQRMPAAMEYLKPGWTTFITNHASDADYRKDQDPDESPRHYIDIDNYPEFLQSGFIHPNYDSIVAQHGTWFVIDQGILPWATLRCYDSLKSCFRRGDWNRSALFAADLSHYVGDGHMPLHITLNYNGQETGQTGIHSRYETKMIARYESMITYTIDSVIFIDDVSNYIFNYLYLNYQYVDSILFADSVATTMAGAVGSDSYYQHLWSGSQRFTTWLMKSGSEALINLIYTAWVEAGSLRMYPNSIDEEENLGQPFISAIYPNPARDHITIPLVNSGHRDLFTFRIYDIYGRQIDTFDKQVNGDEVSYIRYDIRNLKYGIYMCRFQSGSFTGAARFIVTAGISR